MTLPGMAPEDWDEMAPEYPKSSNMGFMAAPSKRVLSAMNSITPFASATSILDVGCGPGSSLVSIFEDYGSQIPSGTRIVGCDFSQGMIDLLNTQKAEKAAESPLWASVEAAVYDAENLSEVADGSVSHVLGNMVYPILLDPRKSFVEAHRVLKSGGVFGLTSWAKVEWFEILQQLVSSVRPDAPVGFDEGMLGKLGKVEGVREELEAVGFKDIVVDEVTVEIPAAALTMMGPGLVRSKSPSTKKMLGTFTSQERDRVLEEWNKMIENRAGVPVKGVAISASARK